MSEQERPAPTCKCTEPEHCCIHFPENCVSHGMAPVARDASVDAPLWNHEQYDEEIAALNKALRSEVASVDRLRAELAAANEQIARLKADVDMCKALDNVIAVAHANHAHAATTAKLGRAVAILPDALKWIEAETVQLKDALPYDACIAEIRAILADADCTQAAEAWAEGQQLRVAFERLKMEKKAHDDKRHPQQVACGCWVCVAFTSLEAK